MVHLLSAAHAAGGSTPTRRCSGVRDSPFRPSLRLLARSISLSPPLPRSVSARAGAEPASRRRVDKARSHSLGSGDCGAELPRDRRVRFAARTRRRSRVSSRYRGSTHPVPSGPQREQRAMRCGSVRNSRSLRRPTAPTAPSPPARLTHSNCETTRVGRAVERGVPMHFVRALLVVLANRAARPKSPCTRTVLPSLLDHRTAARRLGSGDGGGGGPPVSDPHAGLLRVYAFVRLGSVE